ncbi:MAG: hypothetical protein OXG39_02020 [Chloroflexi bacterium]|nr:hypothetical protein [Chloroflexota bacterium]
MDDSTLQVYTILFVVITIVLVYTSRFFSARRMPRLSQGRVPGFKRLSGWVGEAIEAGRPLHLSFGSAGIDAESAPVAAAEAELFYHVIKAAGSGDVAPVISTSSAATIPLCQDTIRRAWAGDERRSRAQWFPQGPRSMAFAAGLTATMQVEDPSAHVLAGSFGPELALILDSAERQGQGSFAVSDQLEGGAIAFAMADEVLIGEQLFSAAAWLSHESTARADASVQDVWRGLLIALMAILVIIEVAGQLGIASWSLVLWAALALVVIGVVFVRRR